MILEWTTRTPPYQLEWRGPNFIQVATPSMEVIQSKIAVISGPQGAKGDKGDPGDIGGLPAIVDGGNF